MVTSLVTSPASIRRCLCYDRRVTTTRFRGGQIMGIRIPTVFAENDAKRCAGCHEPIEGTPFRISIMDNVAREAPPSWAERAAFNPGPHQFHADPAHFRAWAQQRGYYLCRLSEVRELMRPVPLPLDPPAWGLCDGNHREDHEFEQA
jgi:hypothetical protein